MNKVTLIRVNYDICLHCGGCSGSCPLNAIYLNDYVIEFNNLCNGCGRCVKICPVGALLVRDLD